MKAKILWPQLGWCPWDEQQVPSRNEGPVAFLVIAPWCPDCRDEAPRLRKELAALRKKRPVWVVGEFAPAEESLAFIREHRLDAPVLFGRPGKSEAARSEARFRDLREAGGDTRRWGLPLWIEGRLRNGWLELERVRWPA